MKKEKTHKEVTYEDLTFSNMYQIEALYRIMVNKKLITEKEFLDEIKLIKNESNAKIN